MITIFKNIIETKTPHFIEIEKVFDRIKNGKSKELVEKIRTLKDKKERDNIKKNLPSICFSGKFSKRANDACIQHSGCVCIDFDHVPNYSELRTSLEFDKYTMAVFKSPSGDGLKLIVKIPSNIETHAASCRALKQYYNNPCLDNFEDIARVCYESYDPSIYVNLNSEIFTDLVNEVIVKKENTEKIYDDFEIFEKLKKWIEGTDTYCDGNKHKFLVKFAGALNRYGVSENNASGYLKTTYKNAASSVSSADFDSIVKKVYQTYSKDNSISYFDKLGISYEKHTGKRTNNDIFEYKIEKNENVISKKDIETKINVKDIIDKTYINLDNPPKQMPVYLQVKKSRSSNKLVRLMTSQNISVIKGKAKSKKTSLLSIVCASYSSGNSIANMIYPNVINGKNTVVYIDTEQSEYDVWRVANNISIINNTKNDNFASFAFRGYSANEIIKTIEYLVENFNIAICIIDQIADLLESVNDEKEARALVRWIEKITKEKDFHICCGIHENPDANSTKATGWIGTLLLKKAETVITTVKDSENSSISHVKASFTRGEEFEDFQIMINENGVPEILNCMQNNTTNDFI